MTEWVVLLHVTVAFAFVAGHRLAPGTCLGDA